MELDDTGRLELLKLAERCIAHGAEHGEPPELDERAVDELPDARRATFVSVYLAGELNGCMGRLEASRPLPEDVAMNAYRAAFHDPRFGAPTAEELSELEVEISILSPLESVPVQQRDEVFEHIEPGRDGVVLQRGKLRGTFLPSVWEKCPNPQTFLSHLKRKAGLPMEGWSSDIDVYRYEVDDFSHQTLRTSDAAVR